MQDILRTVNGSCERSRASENFLDANLNGINKTN